MAAKKVVYNEGVEDWIFESDGQKAEDHDDDLDSEDELRIEDIQKRIPRIYGKGNHLMIVAADSDGQFNLYWFELKGDALVPVSKFPQLKLACGDQEEGSINESNSWMRRYDLGYLQELDMMTERLTFFTHCALPSLAIIRPDASISLYFLNNRKIIQCSGLHGSIPIEALYQASGKEEVVDDGSSDLDNSSICDKQPQHPDDVNFKENIRHLKVGWSSQRKSLILVYKNLVGNNSFIISEFALRL